MALRSCYRVCGAWQALSLISNVIGVSEGVLESKSDFSYSGINRGVTLAEDKIGGLRRKGQSTTTGYFVVFEQGNLLPSGLIHTDESLNQS